MKHLCSATGFFYIADRGDDFPPERRRLDAKIHERSFGRSRNLSGFPTFLRETGAGRISRFGCCDVGKPVAQQRNCRRLTEGIDLMPRGPSGASFAEAVDQLLPVERMSIVVVFGS